MLQRWLDLWLTWLDQFRVMLIEEPERNRRRMKQ